MIFLIFTLGFKIIGPQHAKKHIKDQFNCQNEYDLDFIKEGPPKWQWKEEFLCRCEHVSVYRCKFGKFRIYGHGQSSLMWCWRSFYAESCEFFEIDYVKILLCLNGDNEIGSIKNCQFRDVGNDAVDTQTIFSSNRHNEFIGNKFTFSNWKSGRIFDIKYHSGTKFIGNIIENAWCGKDSSAILFVNNQDGVEDLIMKDCIFKNCTGNNPSVFRITYLCYDLTLQNITYENCKNTGSSEYYLSKIVAYNHRQNTLSLKFKDCKFINLESKCVGGGGIGLFYMHDNTGSENFLYLVFENTKFEHILNTEQSVGGGAISICPSSTFRNYNTHLTVTNCIFNDVRSSGSGGAIYYDSNDFNININGCKFTNTNANNGAHSIYINKDNTEKVSVSNCIFTDCGSQESTFAIELNAKKYDFLYNTITFTNPSRSCGCISTNKITEHIYRGNLFHNAKNNKNYDSVGINEPGSSNSAILTIENNTFDGLDSPCQGKCMTISFLSDNGLTIKNNTFINCKGSGFYIKVMFINRVDSFKISTCKFIGNEIGTTWNGEFGHCPHFWIQNKETNPYTYKMTLSFEDCYFERNKSPKMGGAVNYGKNRYNSNTYICFLRCEFIENSATEGGGALALITYQGCHLERCVFKKNYADIGNGAIYVETEFHDTSNPNTYPSDRNPDVTIESCTFIENGENKANNVITLSSSPNVPVSITNCSFINSKINNYVIEISSNVQSTSIQRCTIEFTNNDGRGGIYVGSSGKITIDGTQFLSTSKKSALAISSSDTSSEISIIRSTFDSCNANEYSCFNLAICTHSFFFEHNVISKSILSGYNNYIGNMVLNTKDVSLLMNNITFIDNICSSLYGGGVGIRFINIDTLLHFKDCKFINNEARQDTSYPRPYQVHKGLYYNGDGGGIQIGYHCLMNKMAIKFEMCKFSNNKAQRHGGAMAIQTLNTVEIIGCTFENNLANYNFQSSKSELLVENHFDKKSEGRGGAIYINPIYTYMDPKAQCDDPTTAMASVLIKQCKLMSNSAFDGYAMYIESDDDPGTTFTFDDNNFFDNYNESNYVSDKFNLYGAVITTELHSITEDDFKNCHFSYLNDNLHVNKVSHVDHYGKTPTKQFTESDYFPSNGFSDSSSFSNSNYFSKSNGFTSSEKFIKTNDFTSSLSFSKSNDFTESNTFTKSDNFKQTSAFTNSDCFKQTSAFTNSDYFMKTSAFTKSDSFSSSKYFSNSFYFSKSTAFSSSNSFSNLLLFTENSEITETKLNSSTLIKEPETSYSNIESSSLTDVTETSYSNIESSSQTEEHEINDSNIKSSSLTEELKTFYSISDSKTTYSNAQTLDPHESSLTNSKSSSISEQFGATTTIFKTSSLNDEYEKTIINSENTLINEEQVDSKSYNFDPTSYSEVNKPISSNDIKTKDPNSETKIESSAASKSNVFNYEPDSMSKVTKKANIPMIVGIVIGIIAAIVIVILILFFVLRKKRETSDFDENLEMTIESNMQNDSDEEFNNPLYNPNMTGPDPFDQQFDEDLI